jgi:hypothetical protein
MDLKRREREIIEGAMAGKPAHLLRSQQRDWYRMFPAVVEQATGRPIREVSHAILSS